MIRVLVLGGPVATGFIGFGNVATAAANRGCCACGKVCFPAQHAPLAHQLGVEHVGSSGPGCSEAILQHVELTWIAGPDDDGAVLAAEHVLNLTVVETSEYAALTSGFIDFEELPCHPGAGHQPPVEAHQR